MTKNAKPERRFFIEPDSQGYQYLRTAKKYDSEINREASLSIEDLPIPADKIVQETKGLTSAAIHSLRNERKQPYSGRILIPISGGVDSSTNLKLAVEAVGPKQVITAHFQHREKPLETELQDNKCASLIQDFCNIPIENRLVIDISSMLKTYAQLIQNSTADNPHKPEPIEYSDATVWNRAAVIRGLEQRYNAFSFDSSCLSEDLFGQFTTGNARGHIGLTERLLKLEIRNLARSLGLPKEIWGREKTSGEVGSTTRSTWGADERILDLIAIGYLYGPSGKREELISFFEKSLGHGRNWLGVVVDSLLMCPLTKYNTGEPTLKISINYGKPKDFDSLAENAYFSYRNTLPAEEKCSDLLRKIRETRLNATGRFYKW